MPRKTAKKKTVRTRKAAPKQKMPAPAWKKHVTLLYAFMIFTWIMVLSMFLEGVGGFVINLKTTLFGFIIGIGTAALIFYK